MGYGPYHLSTNNAHQLGDPADNDIANIANIILDRKKTIFLVILLCLGLSVFYLARTEQQYIASSQIMVTTPNLGKQTTILQALVSTGNLDITDLRSQIEIIQSPDTLRQLAEKTGLYRDPEMGGGAEISDFASLPLQRQQIILSNIGKRLSVKPVLGTAIIEISFRSNDPKKAANITNALVAIYIEGEREKARAQAKSISDWLSTRLEILRQEVRDAELALEEVREGSDVTGGKIGDSRLIQIDLLGKQLAAAQNDFVQIQSTLTQIKALKETKQDLATLPEIIDNRLIQGYKQAETALLSRRAEMAKRYGPNHPDMIALNAELATTRMNIRDEVQKLVKTLENRMEMSQETIRDIQEKIENYQKSYQDDSVSRLRIRDLESNAMAARTLFNNFMASYRESLQNIDVGGNRAQIVAAATPPVFPSYPQKSLIFGLSGITGLFLGIFIALLLERIQNVFQNSGQIERLSGLPVYGILPKIRNFKKTERASEYVLAHPASGHAELVRSLYMAIKLRDPNKKSGGRVMTVTSTLPDEGKTTTAIWLATTAAQNGEKVLIIDADMRRPSLHKDYDIGNARGLADYLSDRLPLDDTIYKKHASGVHIMTSKAIPTHALTLLTSERMESMIRRLRDIYDLIIIDVPTALVFSDARVMAKLSDKTLYVVEWKKTRRDVFMNSVKQFTDMGYQELAFVLNKTEMKHFMATDNGDLAYLYQMDKAKGKSRFSKA